MLPRPKFLLLSLVALTVAACGLKGPLYRPDQAQTPSGRSTQPAETSTKKKDSSRNTQPGDQTEPPVAPPDPDGPVVPPGR